MTPTEEIEFLKDRLQGMRIVYLIMVALILIQSYTLYKMRLSDESIIQISHDVMDRYQECVNILNNKH